MHVSKLQDHGLEMWPDNDFFARPRWPTVPPMNLQNRDSQAIAFLAVCSGAALILALIAQYSFNLWPCTVCYWQRVPYGFTLFLTVMAAMPVVDAPSRRLVIQICAGLFLINAGIAFYHVGVEARWWPGPTQCAGRAQDYTPADLIAALNQPGRTGCEDPAFVMLGISMAGYNVMVCLVLAFLSTWAARQDAWWTIRP